MVRYRAPAIKDHGLKVYLNEKYADYGGYAEFERRYRLREPKTIIARAFGLKTVGPVRHWMEIYKEEQASL